MSKRFAIIDEKVINSAETYEAVFGTEDSAKLSGGRLSVAELTLKKELLKNAEAVLLLPKEDYSHGGIIFLKRHSDCEPNFPFGDTLILVVNDSGDSTGHSERLNIKMPISYVDNRFTVLRVSGIRGVSFDQHSCPNPDCPACRSHDDKDPLPYNFMIHARDGDSTALVISKFEDAYAMAAEVINRSR
jgi:hypothetical protein